MQEEPVYKPVSVQDTTDYDPMRGTVPAKRVNFRRADGTVSYVVLPRSEYNAESVTKALEDDAAQHEAVMQVKVRPGQRVYSPPSNPFS